MKGSSKGSDTQRTLQSTMVERVHNQQLMHEQPPPMKIFLAEHDRDADKRYRGKQKLRWCKQKA